MPVEFETVDVGSAAVELVLGGTVASGVAVGAVALVEFIVLL